MKREFALAFTALMTYCFWLKKVALISRKSAAVVAQRLVNVVCVCAQVGRPAGNGEIDVRKKWPRPAAIMSHAK
jgi:hypothetical protein